MIDMHERNLTTAMTVMIEGRHYTTTEKNVDSFRATADWLHSSLSASQSKTVDEEDIMFMDV